MEIYLKDSENNLRLPVLPSSFEYLEKDGTGDVYFSLSLIESVTLKTSNVIGNATSSTAPNMNDRVGNAGSSTNTTHTVIEGDTLWGIAQKHYGNGSSYSLIQQKNLEKYPSLAKNTIIQVGWVLEL